jgi:hypothetical protein
MDSLMPLASALGLGMLAGARLYATVFAIGLLLRFHRVALPEAWQHASVLADTRVLAFAGAACLVEFLADKIPWVDSAWDSVHTFVRPVGAALLTSSLLTNVDPAYRVLLFFLAGGVALSGHSAKAAARLAVNHSPEPFSNIALSMGEDAFGAVGLYLAIRHPWILAGAVLVFLALFAWLAPKAYRALRAEAAAIAALFRHWMGSGPVPEPRGFRVIATADVPGLRNALGTLSLSGREAAFLTRRWRRQVERRIGPVAAVEARRGILVDRLDLVLADGRRIRFDLLAGQLARARAAAAVPAG